jgi:N-acylglucosamine-6-phosphate 2-epimerase
MSDLEALRGGLIVSVQAWGGSAIDDPAVLAAMAAAAQANGAAGLRMQGAATLRAARARVELPIVGIIKREYPGFDVYITPTLEEVREVAEAGAEIVAFDATARARPDGSTVATIVGEIVARGCIAMADCATTGDAMCALAAGAHAIATTLCGYTPETKGMPLPALDAVRAFAELGAFTVCEGGIHAPGGVADAFAAGADAAVVGTAITNIDWLVREFASRAPKTSPREG